MESLASLIIILVSPQQKAIHNHPAEAHITSPPKLLSLLVTHMLCDVGRIDLGGQVVSAEHVLRTVRAVE